MRGKLLTLTGLLIAALSAVGLGGRLLAQGPTSLSVDVIPTGNTPTSVASIEPCASASKGDEFNVDIIIQDVTDLLAWEMVVSYDPNVLQVIASDAQMFQSADGASRVLDLSETIEPGPDDDGRYHLQSVDTADPPAPDSGSGVLARLTFKAVGEGTSPISLAKLDLDEDGTPDQGILLRDVDAEVIGDRDGDTLFDGPVADGEIRVGERCPDAAEAVVEALNSDDSISIALVAGVAGGGFAGLIMVGTLAAILLRRRAAV